MHASRNLLARLLITLVVCLAAGAVLWAIGPSIFLPPLPPPPTITAPRGDLPAGAVTFRERVPGGPCVGSGFFLALPDGDVVALATAHSHNGWPAAGLEFTGAACDAAVYTFTELYTPAGRPREGFDLRGDYLIMRPPAAPDAAAVLQPDPRGAPQPGERVLLYPGLAGAESPVEGTVESAGSQGAWIRMAPGSVYGGMSGSPVLSAHTGRVVGMAIVISLRPGATTVGINPIGALVQAARAGE